MPARLSQYISVTRLILFLIDVVAHNVPLRIRKSLRVRFFASIRPIFHVDSSQLTSIRPKDIEVSETLHYN